MSDLIERLNDGEIIIADGAALTALTERIPHLKNGTAQFNETHYEDLRQVHLEYREAGSRISIANTLRGSRKGLEAVLPCDHIPSFVQRINEAGVDAARYDGLPVLGAVTGEYGGQVIAREEPEAQSLLSIGFVAASEACRIFQEQARYLIEAGVDALYGMTFLSAQEALAFVSAAKRVKEDIPLIVAFSFDNALVCGEETDYFTSYGTSPNEAVANFKGTASVIGANCVNAVHAPGLVREFRKYTDMPLIMQPNAGLPDHMGRYTMGPEEFAAHMVDAINQNGSGRGLLLGGCCGTTPEYIRALNEKKAELGL